MSSIYDLDPQIRKLLSLDNFLDSLSVYEFIEELSKDHSLKGAEVNSLEYLDPKPYIRTFESTLRELNKLNTEALSKKEILEKDVSKYELSHSRNVLSLTSRTDSVNTQFKYLDDQISNISSSIVPLSESLSKTINAKERTIATVSLVRIYNDFYQIGSSKELEHLINGGIKDKRKCATTVAQLLSLSSKLVSSDLPKSKNCHDLVQKYSENMENSLLDDFNTEYRANNLYKMKDIADILADFNGGVAVIKNFVNQNDVFLDTNKNSFDDLPENIETHNIWEQLSDPTNHKVLSDVFCKDLFDKMEKIIENETRVISEVFRDPVEVLSLFVQRIYAQQIQSRVELLLRTSYSTSSLAFLRTLYSLYNFTGNFTKDLKTFFQSLTFNVDPLIAILDQSYSDLFTEHLSEDRYFEQEKKTLESILYTFSSNYEHLNESKIQNKLSSKVLSSDLDEDKNNEYDNLNRRSKVRQLKNFMKSHLERTTSFKEKRTSSSLSLSDSAGNGWSYSKIDVEEAENMLKSTVESLSRILELTPYKTAEHGLDILKILLVGVGKSYVDLGLEVSYTDLTHQDSRNDIDFGYLYNVKLSSEILYLVSSCIRTIILPLSNNSPHLKHRMTSLTNGYISRVEISINTIIQETISLSHDKITNALSKQKKKDFLPKVGELSDTDTVTCEQLSTFLIDINSQFREYLNGENLSKVLMELGEFTFQQLFEHFKNFQINSTGGIVVTKDIISYQTAIEEWKLPALTEKFQVLREIANLFTVQPELLNSLTKEGHLASVKPYILRQFIVKRSDYNTNTSYVAKLKGYI